LGISGYFIFNRQTHSAIAFGPALAFAGIAIYLAQFFL